MAPGQNKSLLSLAAAVGGYLVAYAVAVRSAPLSRPQAVVGMVLAVGLPLVAIVLAIWSIRERRAAGGAHRATRVRTYAPAALAILLALPDAGGFIYYSLSRRTSAAPGWFAFTSPDGDFTVMFPGRPDRTTLPREQGAIHVTAYSTGPGGQGYMVMAGGTPGAAGGLDGAASSVVQRSKGKLLSERTVASGGIRGRALEIAAPGRRMHIRLFLANGRIYEVLATHAPDDAPGDPDRDRRFFQSFMLRRTNGS